MIFSLPPSPVIHVPTSKSIANRLLIIQALSGQKNTIQAISSSDDTRILKEILQSLSDPINTGHAGTAYRFLTAYLAWRGTPITLDGSERMRERPIGILVDALRHLGADIHYVDKQGYPPIRIQGGALLGTEVSVAANTSSQFVSALMLIAPYLPDGLCIHLLGSVVSQPYVEMTARLMQQCGVHVSRNGSKIQVAPGAYDMPLVEVEADWSAISFWYVWVLLGKIPHLVVKNVSRNSIQGDAYVQQIFSSFGVKSRFESTDLVLTFEGTDRTSWPTHFDFSHTPDLTQPFMVAMAGVGHLVEITGVHHLQLKETKRLDALESELAKFGAQVSVGENTIALIQKIHLRGEPVTVNTFDDHRMAMAFAPLQALGRKVHFDHPEVVSKSYPEYWQEVAKFFVQEEA